MYQNKNQLLRIEYWSDYVCPFCYIGMRNLKTAITQLHLEDQVEVIMKSFELDRYARTQVVFTAAEHFASKYGIIQEKAREQVENISKQGREAGISDMDYAGTKTTNTLRAHQLTKYAAENGIDLQEDLYHAFFCDHKNIGETNVLIELAEKRGLNRAEVENLFLSKKYVREVREEEKEAALRGIHMVPHFLFAGKLEHSGSGSLEEMKKLLKDFKGD